MYESLDKVQSRTYVAVLSLDEFEERRHVGSAEVVNGLQPGEHAAVGQPLEVILTNVLKE